MSEKDASILIVDDEPEIVNILKEIFTKFFPTILTASNGKSAMEVILKEDPDIVLTDIHMPGCSGMDLVVKMRSEGKNTPVVMISSSQERDDLLKAMKLGVNEFIEKPFKRSEVEGAVHRVLEMTVRNNDIPKMIFLYGKDSKEVKQQRKFVGLLQALSVQGQSEQS